MDVAGNLEEGLRNLSSVRLKPQQCLYMLKTNLLPAINYQLVLATASKKYLLWLDRMVRVAVRTWLKYPLDTPKAYFHANISDGGLGIVSLELQIPLLKIKRINRLWASDDPVIREMLKMESAESLLARRHVPSRLRGVVLNSPESLRAALAEELHSPVDGRGLEQRSCSNTTSMGCRNNGSAFYTRRPVQPEAVHTWLSHVMLVDGPKRWVTHFRYTHGLMLQGSPDMIRSFLWCRPPRPKPAGLASGSLPFQRRPVCVGLT